MKYIKLKSFLSILVSCSCLSFVNINKSSNLYDVDKSRNEILKDNYIYQTYLDIDKVTNKGDTYYVSPIVSKDNEGDGKSKLSPLSIEFLRTGLNNLKPGDTVILLEGTYVFSGQNTRLYLTMSGEYNKYITIKSETNKNTVLDFSCETFLDTNRAVSINGNYIYWKGIDVTGAGDNGLYIGGSYNIVEDSKFYNNRDSGLQLGRASGDLSLMERWPAFNYIRNCTSFNNYDNETYGENADGFAAKLTIGEGNIFDGCIAYRNSDDGWDLYAKTDTGNIGTVVIFNCVAFENGFLAENQETCNSRFATFDKSQFGEKDSDGNDKSYSFNTRDGDGNGFKLGGSIMEGNTYIYNSMAFNNKMHGITDNSNPGVIYAENCTSIDNGAVIDDNKNSSTYGQIIKGTSDQESGEECSNIDLSRQTYSYNVVKNCLSLKSSYTTSIGKDEVRGEITNSILSSRFNSSELYKINGDLDADTKEGVTGDVISNISVNDVFDKVPVEYNNNNYVYNISGLANYNVHETYRNNDNSINMRDILHIKNYNLLFGNTLKIGCDLTKSSWDNYDHYEWSDYSEYSSKEDVNLALARNVLFIPVNKDATYQDFKVNISIQNVSVTWTSSDENVLGLGDLSTISASGTRTRNIIVYRDALEDKKATLTATLKLNDKTVTKEFEFNVKKGDPALGDITVAGIVNGRFIYNAYTNTKLPKIIVTDANDYSGKAIDESLYEVNTKYFYATDKNSTFYQVNNFTTSKPGVFRIVNNVTLKKNGQMKTYTYDVYVASASSNVDFDNKVSNVNVNKDGFTISGNMTSATGKIFVLTSPTKQNYMASDVMTNGEEKSFRNDSISFDYIHSNNNEYYVYYVISNLNGVATSEVYERKVEVVSINSEQEFNSIFSSETSSSKIYTLSKDLDFSSVRCTTGASEKAFKGLFNGLGHTISNVTVNSTKDSTASIFYNVEGGTIENIKFNNLSFNAGNNNKQVGIVGKAESANFYNIAITNVSSFGKERVGGLVGQIFEGSTTISNVSVSNDSSHIIKADSKDAGGIVGLCQTTSSPVIDFEINMSNILVNAYMEASTYSGGLIGRYDDQKPTIRYNARISKVVTYGYTKTSGNYCGGVMNEVATSRIYIDNVVSMINLYHKGSSHPLEISEKNSSPIMGRNGSQVSVTACAATIAEYNSSYDVSVYRLDIIKDASKYFGISLGNNFINNPNVIPYYTLKFLDV